MKENRRDKQFGRSQIMLIILSLLPCLCWPIIYFGSIFIFDDPSANPKIQYFLFYAINAYPVYLIINMMVANKLYARRPKVSKVLYLWPMVLLGVLLVLAFA